MNLETKVAHQFFHGLNVISLVSSACTKNLIYSFLCTNRKNRFQKYMIKDPVQCFQCRL